MKSSIYRDLYKKYCTEENVAILEKAMREGKKVYVRMKKSCYGTKQAARNFYEKMNGIMNKIGFYASDCDPCLYIRWDGDDFLLLAVHVDDMMGTGTSDHMFDYFLEEFQKELEITNLGEIHECLGMVANRKEDGSILLHNPTYIENMLKTYDMEECGFEDTPAIPHAILKIEDCIDKKNYVASVQERYRSVVGSLLYAAIMWRPDIMYITTQLARFNGVAGQKHVHAANRVLKYLKKTKDFGLYFKAGRKGRKVKPLFVTSCDASYASDEDRLSISGWIRQMVDADDWENRNINLDDPNFNCISYSSKRQKGIVATSSTEAEYIAGAECYKMIKHSVMKWEALGFAMVKPSLLYVDNSAMITIIDDWKLSERSRHIDIRFHHIRIGVVSGDLKMVKIHTDANTSDMTTKSLAREPLERHRGKLMIGDIHPLYQSRRRQRASRYNPIGTGMDRMKNKGSDHSDRDAGISADEELASS